MNIHTTEGMIEAHTQGAAQAQAALVEAGQVRARAQYRFDTVGLPRDAVLSAKVL